MKPDNDPNTLFKLISHSKELEEYIEIQQIKKMELDNYIIEYLLEINKKDIIQNEYYVAEVIFNEPEKNILYKNITDKILDYKIIYYIMNNNIELLDFKIKYDFKEHIIYTKDEKLSLQADIKFSTSYNTYLNSKEEKTNYYLKEKKYILSYLYENDFLKVISINKKILKELLLNYFLYKYREDYIKGFEEIIKKKSNKKLVVTYKE